jgi:hypothetical protein
MPEVGRNASESAAEGLRRETIAQMKALALTREAREFPDWRQIASDLRRPFTIHAVQFRILQGKLGKSNRGDEHKATVAAYISARTAADRLDHVCPGLWEHGFVPVDGGLRCDLTIGGITRPDVGWSRGTGNGMDLKALYSDAFKRAAVMWGVGRYLYSLPGMTLWAGDDHIRTWEKPGGGRNGAPQTQYYLKEKGERELRRRYDLWLQEFGVQAFGEPLDHGHVEGSADPEEPVAEPDDERAEAVAPVVVPLEVLAIKERAEKLGHAALSDIDSLTMMTGGRRAGVVKAQVAEWNAELDAMERGAPDGPSPK